MDRATAKKVAEDAKAALEAVAERHGLKLSFKAGSFDPAGTYRPRVEFQAAGLAASEWAQWAPEFGLAVEDFGAIFTTGGHSYAITGIKPSAYKRPILARELGGGKAFVFPAEAVKKALALASVKKAASTLAVNA